MERTLAHDRYGVCAPLSCNAIFATFLMFLGFSLWYDTSVRAILVSNRVITAQSDFPTTCIEETTYRARLWKKWHFSHKHGECSNHLNNGHFVYDKSIGHALLSWHLIYHFTLHFACCIEFGVLSCCKMKISLECKCDRRMATPRLPNVARRPMVKPSKYTIEMNKILNQRVAVSRVWAV